MNKKLIYDLIVLGGGSGGLGCARRASQYGAKVLVVESGRLGGTCVNVGCVPKKVMWHAATAGEWLHDMKDYGYDVEPKPFNWKLIKDKRDAYVTRLNGIYARNLDKDNVEKVEGHAKFVNSNTIQVDNKNFEGKNIVIAVGGHPTFPKDIPGYELGISSDGFFELEDLPKRTAIVGSGYIGVELAGILNGLGSEVQLLIRSKALLRKFDREIVNALDEEMIKSGVNIRRETQIVKVEGEKGKELTLNLTDGSTTKVDCLIWAIGREPNVENLGLKEAGVKTKKNGTIIVDAMQSTNVDNVFALGDVCGKAELTPVAIAAGRKLAARLFNNEPYAKLDYNSIPTVIFSHPPIGTCGISEEEAAEKYGAASLSVYTSRFTNMYHAMTERKSPTLMKVITVKPDEKVVGIHLFGIAVDEMMQGFGLAVKLGITKAQLDSVIAIHPTGAEEVVTMRGPRGYKNWLDVQPKL